MRGDEWVTQELDMGHRSTVSRAVNAFPLREFSYNQTTLKANCTYAWTDPLVSTEAPEAAPEESAILHIDNFRPHRVKMNVVADQTAIVVITAINEHCLVPPGKRGVRPTDAER